MNYELSQLIRILMRQIASAVEEGNTQNGLLLQAISIAKTEIEERAGDAALHFDFGWDSFRQKHQFTAKEMSVLRDRLKEARQTEVVRPPRRVTRAEVPFRVMDLGSSDALEGLIVQTLVDEWDLNLEQIRQDYYVEGDWFPFQVAVSLDGAEITCVIIDDGSILTFLAGYPPSLIGQARSAIERLARSLYASSSGE